MCLNTLCVSSGRLKLERYRPVSSTGSPDLSPGLEHETGNAGSDESFPRWVAPLLHFPSMGSTSRALDRQPSTPTLSTFWTSTIGIASLVGSYEASTLVKRGSEFPVVCGTGSMFGFHTRIAVSFLAKALCHAYVMPSGCIRYVGADSCGSGAVPRRSLRCALMACRCSRDCIRYFWVVRHD
jgi:hypothetical protein